MLHLIRKYNQPIPRYTSYPTVPMWGDPAVDRVRWNQVIKQAFDETNEKGISLYLHLPYCEKLCTYCACNKRITKNHTVEDKYITALLNEWAIYKTLFDGKPKLKEIHLGGGTPTFFSPENLEKLMLGIFKDCEISNQPEFSFEGHPNNTTYQHLETFYNLGFRRVSFGIQDINEEVQLAINRIQPFYNVVNVTRWAREIGYTSVNFDFVYGLPFQNTQNLARTIQTSLKLKPDRVAFYSYAHIPWTYKGQRAYSEEDLPGELEKANMYLMAREIFMKQGYQDIGMDHFALAHDDLTLALNNETLHRNFMGYTTACSELLIGLGCSSISDAKYAYSQNEKNVEKYIKAVNNGQLPLTKGHFLSPEDQNIRKVILKIACSGKYEWTSLPEEELIALQELSADGIIEFTGQSFQVTKSGKLFLRNVCAVFDVYLDQKRRGNRYSKVI
jgi:oxygen-independent coproporphyrinogen III oxidase